MMPTPAGILLPASALNEPWFTLLATIVAFNTLIYVGLTISKVIPWPRQFHPSRVRRWLNRPDPSTDEGPPVAVIPQPEQPESDDPYEAMRRNVARRDIPQAFTLVGGLVILFSLAGFLGPGDSTTSQHLIELFAGVAFLLASQVLGRRFFRAVTMMWTWAIASVLLVGLMLGEALANSNAVPLLYALIVMTAFAPVVMAWRPSIVAGSIMLVALSYVSLKTPGDEDGRTIVAGFAALLTSATLLRLRQVSVDALSTEQQRSNALATTDPLTGALTRQGLLTLMPGMAATATRTGEEVCVMLFDIDQLARANADYGITYGDDVLRAVSRAIHETVRTGDLVARWGEDEFLVAGLGSRPSADQLSGRIQEAVRHSGVNLGKWPTTVSVGTAAGDPSVTTFDALVHEALLSEEGSATGRP